MSDIFPTNMLDIGLKYRKLFNNRLNGMACCQVVVGKNGWPIDYIFLEANKTFEKMTGLKRKDVIGRKVTSIIPGYKKSKFNLIDVYGKVALTGKEATFEQYQESVKKWYSLFVYSPKRGFFVSISSDITERKKAEEEIKKLNIELKRKVVDRTKKYQDLVENINDAIYQLDIKGSVVYASPVVKQITGYDVAEIIGKNVTDFVHPDDLDEARIKFREAILGKSDPYETRIIKKDGSVAYIRSSGHSLIKSGKIKGVVSVLTDITDRKKREKRLLESYSYLGVMNRKISMLLDLEKVSSGVRKKNKRKFLDYILQLTINISGADTSALFKINKDENFELLFSFGMPKDQIKKIRKLSIKKCKILERVWDEKSKVFGSATNNNIRALDPTRKNKHFLILPIKNCRELKGLLFLGFNKEDGIDNHELEFLEVFATHVSVAVIRAEIIK